MQRLENYLWALGLGQPVGQTNTPKSREFPLVFLSCKVSRVGLLGGSCQDTLRSTRHSGLMLVKDKEKEQD